SNPFIAVNTSLFRDGALLDFGNGVAVREPIHLIYVSTSERERTTSYPRTLIVLGTGAQATVAEIYVSLGEGSSFTNAVTEINVGPGASLAHCRVIGASERGL